MESQEIIARNLFKNFKVSLKNTLLVAEKPEQDANFTISKGMYKASYSYKGFLDDEISISPGDIIRVENSQCASDGYCYGNKNGKNGYFPKFFTEELPSSIVTNEMLSPNMSTLNNDTASATPKEDDVQCKMADDKGGLVPMQIMDNEDGTYTVDYVPPSAGNYKVSVAFAGKEIPNSPIPVKVQPQIDVSKVKVDQLEPSLCPDWPDMKPENTLQNARDAMNLADDWLGIPQLVKPEEMVPNVDELSMMTYLSQYPKAELKPGAPLSPKTNPNRVKCYGPGIEPTGVNVGAPTMFTIETFSAGKSHVEVIIENPKSQRVLAEVKFNDDRSKTYTVTYTALTEGAHKVKVLFAEKEVPKSPFNVMVEGHAGDLSKVTASGPSLEPTGVMVGKPTYFDIFTKDSGLGQVEVIILDPKGNRNSVPCRIRKTEENTYRCEYVAQTIGLHSVNVFFAGQQIPKSPFGVRVEPDKDVLKLTIAYKKRKFGINISTSSTIMELKTEAEKVLGLAPEHQQLFYKGSCLKNHMMIGEKLKNETCLLITSLLEEDNVMNIPESLQIDCLMEESPGTTTVVGSFLSEEENDAFDFFIPFLERQKKRLLNRNCTKMLLQRFEIFMEKMTAKCIKNIGKSGLVLTDLNSILKANRIRMSYPRNSDSSILCITQEDFKNRLNLTNTFTVTVDSTGTNILDDAISIKTLSMGKQLIINVADVQHFIKLDSPTDAEAKERFCNLFISRRKAPMLPKEYEDFCSLKPNQNRLTVSLILNFDENGFTHKYFCLAIINSIAKLSYKDAEDILNDNQSATEKFKNVPYRLQDLKEGLHDIVQLTNIISMTVFKKQCVHDINQPKFCQVIECLNLIYNFYAAEFMFERIPDCALFKGENGLVQKLPSATVKEFLNYHNMMNWKEVYISKNYRRDEDLSHTGLKLPYYTQSSSPIRRYPDICVQRQIVAALKLEPPPLDENRIEKECGFLNGRLIVKLLVEASDFHLPKVFIRLLGELKDAQSSSKTLGKRKYDATDVAIKKKKF